MEKRKSKCNGYGMFTGVYWVTALGVVLSMLIGIPIKQTAYGWEGSASELAALLACGIALAYILLSALDWVVQWRALASDPLPDELDLSERAIASERLTSLNGCSILHRHIRRLLTAWAAGASGPQVATMAASQMQRTLTTLITETSAFVVLLAAVASFIPPQILLTLSTGLMALLIVVGIARLQLTTHLTGYIESRLLARIGNDTPAAAGIEFTQAVAKSVADSTAALAAAQGQLAEQTAKAQTAAAEQVAQAQAQAAAVLAKTQEETATRLTKAQDKISEQLARIGEMAATIDGIFKLQQAVDGAIKGVAVADGFQSTLEEFKRHLAASDDLLKNAAKPRTIRLVEKDSA